MLILAWLRSILRPHPLASMRFHGMIFLTSVVSLSCLDGGDPPPVQADPPVIIPTTHAFGPGGAAYMRGTLKDYGGEDRSASDTHLYLMEENVYSDTLLHVFVNSTDGSFLITDLPSDTIDILFVSGRFLSAKISTVILDDDHNAFQNLGNQGLWIDSTLFMVSVADSVPRPGMPQIGFLGYGNSLVALFEKDVSQTQIISILSPFVFDTLQVLPDSINGALVNVLYPPNTNTLTALRLSYLNWLPEIQEAGPVLLVVNP